MGRSVLVVTNAHLKLADDSAGLATAPDFACQVSSAAINAVPNSQTVPATFCAAESSVPGQTGWEMALSWLQDWDVIPATGSAVGSLSQYAFNNDAALKAFSLSLTSTGPPIATGSCYIVSGSFGGDAGTPLLASATWPLAAKPTVSAGTKPVPAMMEFGVEGQSVEGEEQPVEETVPA